MPKANSKANGNGLVAVAEDAKAAKQTIYTPSQVIGTFTEPLAQVDKSKASKLKGLYDDLLEGFANESQGRISVGGTLVKIQELLGEDFTKFLNDCVVKTLRKSIRTCWGYIALYRVFSHKFPNPVFKTALSRIWGAEGCFDTVNGELSPAVDQAIGAIGGIPAIGTDSVTCEVKAREFVAAVDKLVAQGRKAEPGGRKWDAATMDKKHESVVKGFKSYIGNKSVSANRATKLLTAILVEAMVEMSVADVNNAFTNAKTEISNRKLNVKKAHDEENQAVA